MRKFTNIFRTKRKNNISLILSALCLLMAASCLSAHESNAVEYSLQGHIVDIEHQTVYPGEIKIADGKITDIVRLSDVDASAPYYLPGFIDGHIHIESSMLTPENFARLAVAHGTVGVVADPHEITNVLGETGINFMIDNAASSRLKFHFGLPSCVPSSHLETAGAVIDAVATERLIQNPDIHFLAEMMNYPGVIYENAEVMAKLAAARKHNKPIDGHAPGLTGANLDKYIAAGISTDHECSTLEEARERVDKGMMVIVREGSSARNFDALAQVIAYAPEKVMLCSDDKHPDDLIAGHIDGMVRQGLAKGIPVWNLLTAACVNPVKHYGIDCGLMRKGDNADFIAVDNLEALNVVATYIDGRKVYDRTLGVDNTALATGISAPSATPNNFKAAKITESDIAVDLTGFEKVKVIEAFDGELLTKTKIVPVAELSSPKIQKIVVYNRYGNGRPQTAFIEGFNIGKGAIGATIAHDSHNIVTIGASDESIVAAINALIEAKGGVVVVNGKNTDLMPLPIAGLMSDKPGEDIANDYMSLIVKSHALGCTFRSPFITMSFMALPVIPELKLTDKGLVDVTAFDFTPLQSK